MGFAGAVVRGRRFLTRLGAMAVTGIVVLGVVAGAAAPAAAADVDLTVNVSSDRGSYSIDQPAVYTVRVDNRSDQATAAGATVVLDVPNMAGSDAAWETSVSAVSTGGGAAAPTGFVRSADGRSVTATLPAIPAGGWVSYALTAPGHPGGATGSLTVTATVVPAAGDIDVNHATDSATVGVVIVPKPADYSTTITGQPSSGVADGATITADVSVVNAGVGNSLSLALALGGQLGTDARIVDATLLSGPGPVPTLTPGASASLAMPGMPRASTNVIRLTITVGASCNPTGTPRTMTLTSTVGPSGGVAEAAGLNGDNTAVATISVLTPVCLQSDVSVTSLVQTTPASGALPHDGPFAFQAVYTNTGPDTALSSVSFGLSWATGEGGPSMPADPVCVAAGGAVCPTAWDIRPAVVPGTPGLPGARGSSSVTATGTGAVIPPGGTLTISYAGTGGARDDLQCGIRGGSASAGIHAAPSFTDSDPLNNSVPLSVAEDIGIACGIDHDFELTVPVRVNDPNSAPVTGTEIFSPGDILYFDITGINQSDPDQAGLGVAGTAPYVDVNGYSTINSFGMNAPGDFISGNQQFDLSDPGNVFWQSSAGTMPVDPANSPQLSGNPLNISCLSAAPVVCPDHWQRRSTQYPGIHPYPFYFNASWSNPHQTVLPAGSTMTIRAAFRIPALPEQYRQAGCVPQGVLIGGSPTGTSVVMPFNMLLFNEQTTKLSGEVIHDASAGAADRWRGVSIRVNYTRCSENLQIAQTVVDASGAPIASPTLPGDRVVRYAVTITNPAGSSPLALPRFTQAFAPGVVSATAVCDPARSTGGATCPVGTFDAGIRHLADGSTAPVAAGDPQLDVSWGAAGQPTLPVGSSVTFLVEAHYPAETASAATATATALDAAPGSPFPLVSDSDTVAPRASSAVLSVRKSVSPVDPAPGAVVSFVVDLLNAGDASTAAVFVDPLHADLLAANPGGFANLSCAPVTAGMGLLDGTLGSTPCPVLVSDASGIRATIPVLAANSGLRITYTAVAPQTITSTPNIASLYADASLATAADRSAWVNFLVRAPRAEPPAPQGPALAATGFAVGGALVLAAVLLATGVLLMFRRRVRA